MNIYKMLNDAYTSASKTVDSIVEGAYEAIAIA